MRRHDIATDDKCLFCRIAASQVTAEIVAETPTVIAFRDIAPAAPVHVLVVPKDHYPDIGSLVIGAPSLVVDLTRTATEVAEIAGIQDFRLVFNTGSTAGQSVFHVHGHVLGGRKLGWPPG